MKTTQSKHYAKALVELCGERNVSEDIFSNLENILMKIKESKEFNQFLLDRAVDFNKKKEAVEIIFKEEVNLLSLNFVLVLLKNNHISQLEDILVLSKKMFLKSKNLEEAFVESVIPLDEEQESKLKDRISKKFNKKVLFKNKLNKDLIGGIRITIGDTEIDASLRGKFLRLKNKIEKLN